MRGLLCRAAGLAALLAFSPAAFAAAPENLDIAVTPDPSSIDYALDTEMVVKNWVLCISAPLAEELARARAISADDARNAYVALSGQKSCGQFPELRVILQQRLYAADPKSGNDARVFGALVNLSGDWASAFVVSGGLPAD